MYFLVCSKSQFQRPPAKTKSSVKTLASSYLRSVIPCFSMLPKITNKCQANLVSLSTQRDPRVSKASTEAPFRKAIYCLPCIWDVWLALCYRNRSRPPGRKYSGGNKSSSVVLKGGCTCSLPEYVTPSAAFYPEMLPLLNSQFSGKSSVSNLPPQQHLFISTTQLLLTVFVCISSLSALLMLNEAQDSQMWCCSLRGSFGNQRSTPKASFPDWDPKPTPLFVSLQQSSGHSWEIPIRWAWGYLQL